MAKRCLEEGESSTAEIGSILEGPGLASLGNFIGEQFGGVADEKDKGEGGTEGVALTELCYKLLHTEAIMLLDLIEELHCMKLGRTKNKGNNN